MHRYAVKPYHGNLSHNVGQQFAVWDMENKAFVAGSYSRRQLDVLDWLGHYESGNWEVEEWVDDNGNYI